MSATLEKHSLPAPLVWPAFCTGVGIVAARYLPISYLVVAIIGAIALVVSLFFKASRNALIILLFICLGFLRWEAEIGRQSPLDKALAEYGRVQQRAEMQVLRPLSENSYEVRLDRLAGYKVKEKLRLLEDEPLTSGSRLSALVEISVAAKDPILNLYPALGKGTVRLISSPEIVAANAKGTNLIFWATAFINKRLEPLPEKDQELARALLLSDPISKQKQRESLSRAGISHLIVVSGLHVLMLYLIIITILRTFLPHRLADIIFLVFILFFAALNHWAAPISRAILMICMVMFGRWLSRPVAAKQSLAFSFLLLILVQPWQLFEIGFQLSFASVTIIIFMLPRWNLDKETKPVKRRLLSLANYLTLSFLVALGLMPFTLYYFGTASFNSLVANSLGLPLIYGLLGLALAFIFLPLKPLYLSFSWLAQLWDGWLKFCAALPLHIQDAWLPLSSALGLVALLMLLALVLRRRWNCLKYAVLPLVLGFFVLWFWPHPFRDRIMVFNAGTADCSLIFGKNGQRIMIDSGGLYGSRAETSLLEVEDIYQMSWLKQRLIPWLKRNRIHSLDYLLLTHLHSDHASGLPALAKHLEIKQLILSKNDLMSEDWQHLSQGLDLSKTRIIAVEDTLSLWIGGQRLKILHPDAAFGASDANNGSIVCRWDGGRSRTLFTGDLEAAAEAYLARKYPLELKADYLKVAHHGSRGSSSEAFLDVVKAQEAWISCSRRNVYGFPHPETLKRLQERGIRIVYTYEGSINRAGNQLP